MFALFPWQEFSFKQTKQMERKNVVQTIENDKTSKKIVKIGENDISSSFVNDASTIAGEFRAVLWVVHKWRHGLKG